MMERFPSSLFLFFLSFVHLSFQTPPQIDTSTTELSSMELSSMISESPPDVFPVAGLQLDCPLMLPGTETNYSGINTLKYVAIVSRHGSRSPIFTYPNDPYPTTDKKFWPEGAGHLTKFGKRQMYIMGKMIRLRYKRFLSSEYTPEEVTIASNPMDRDIMSAQTFAAGLYPPRGWQMWNKFLKWQPVPVWVDDFDTVFFMDPGYCESFGEELDLYIEFLKKSMTDSKFKRLFSYLSDVMGMEVNNGLQVFRLWDALKMQEENDKKLPDWAKRVLPRIEDFSKKVIWNIVAWNEKMARLSGGPVLRNVTEQILEKVLEKNKDFLKKRLYFDAAHDVTLATLLSLLGVKEPMKLMTSSYIVFELHSIKEQHFVQVLFFNNAFCSYPVVIEIPNCGNPCPLEKFKNMVEEKTPKNWRAECDQKKSNVFLLD